jgi:hypothetical protein
LVNKTQCWTSQQWHKRVRPPKALAEPVAHNFNTFVSATRHTILTLLSVPPAVIAMIVFAWMMVVGLTDWPYLDRYSHTPFSDNFLATPLNVDNFEAIVKCLTGLIGMILTDISMSLAVIRRNGISSPPKSPN